jgi:hypothetical protein
MLDINNQYSDWAFVYPKFIDKIDNDMDHVGRMLRAVIKSIGEGTTFDYGVEYEVEIDYEELATLNDRFRFMVDRLSKYFIFTEFKFAKQHVEKAPNYEYIGCMADTNYTRTLAVGIDQSICYGPCFLIPKKK